MVQYLVVGTFEFGERWDLYMDKGVSAGFERVDGVRGKALKITFNFGEGSWWQISREITQDLTGLEELEISFKYDGPPNTLEIKLEDDDGTNFGVRLPGLTPTPEWRLFKVKRDDFVYFWGGDTELNWRKIKRIWIALSKQTGGTGYIIFDELKIGISLPAPPEIKRVTVDGFERIVAARFYTPFKSQDSWVSLSSSRVYVKEGAYSMKIEYSLSGKTMPPFVSAIHFETTPLNWKGAEKIFLWVMGDGSGNVFEVNVYDADGEIFGYRDRNVLRLKNWTQIEIEIGSLKILKNSPVVDGKLSLDRIKGFEFVITMPEPGESSGVIYIDEFSIEGKEITTAAVPKVVKEVLQLKRPQMNMDVTGTFKTEYENIPEEGWHLWLIPKIAFSSRLGIVSACAEIAAGPFDVGESAAINRYGVLTLYQPNFHIANLFMEIDLNPNWRARFGTMRENISDWTYSALHASYGDWGWMGVRVEGFEEPFLIRGFFIKSGDANKTFAGVAKLAYGAVVGYVAGCYVDYGVDDTWLSDSTFETCLSFRGRTIWLEARGAVNRYKRFADFSIDDPFHPTFNYLLLEPENWQDYAGEFSFRYRHPSRVFDASVSLRAIGENFKPFYRFNPSIFDEQKVNTLGLFSSFNINWMKGGVFFLSDVFRRLSNPDFYRLWGVLGGSYIFSSVMYAGVALEGKIQKDQYIHQEEWVRGLNEEVWEIDERVLMPKIFFEIRPLPRLYIRCEATTTFTWQDQLYIGNSIYVEARRILPSGSYFFVETRVTKYGKKDWEPTTESYTDNFFKAGFELGF